MVQLTMETDMLSRINWDPVQDQFPVHNNMHIFWNWRSQHFIVGGGVYNYHYK